MRGEVAGGGDQDVRRLRRAAQQAVLTEGGFDGLDAVEVAILAQQRLAERGEQAIFVAAIGEVAGDQLAGLVDLLLAIQQRREVAQDGVRAACRQRREWAWARRGR